MMKNTFSVITTARPVLEWVTSRAYWSVEQTEIGITLWGMTHTGREVTATILGETLPKNIRQIKGGVCGWEATQEDWAWENRQVQLAFWALRPLMAASVEAEMDWGDKSPHASGFGQETLAKFGYQPAIKLEADLKAANYMEDSNERLDALCAAYEAAHLPIEPSPLDGWENLPARQPMRRVA